MLEEFPPEKRAMATSVWAAAGAVAAAAGPSLGGVLVESASWRWAFFVNLVIAIAMRILYSILTLIPVAGYLLAWLAVAVGVLGWGILWLVLLVKALQGETFRLPVIGSFAEKA